MLNNIFLIPKKFVDYLIRYESYLVCILLILFSGAALYFVALNNLQLSIEDSRAHLNIARRVFDSQTPGLTQLGGIWLPLPHILMFPFVWHDLLWRSGFAGIFPSMLSYIGASFVVYKLSSQLYKNRLAGLLSVFVFSLNPNLLFIQSTPMSELPSLLLFVASAYFLNVWMTTRKTLYLILTSVLVCLATLTRYDNWVLPLAVILAIIFVGVIKKMKLRRVEALIILFAVPAFLGMIIWSIYNLVIFKNPFHFAVGRGSARWFAQFEAGSGVLPAKGDIVNSVHMFGASVYDVCGPFVLILAFFSTILIIFLLIYRKINLQVIIILAFLFSPLAFNIYSLYSGNSVMWSRWVEPYKIYNVRYALQALPFLAILIGSLSLIRPKILVLGLIALVAFQNYYFFRSEPLIIIQDITQTKGSAREEVAKWIRENPIEGQTLISAGASEVVIFDSGEDIKKFTYEGNKPMWDKALVEPHKYVDRIVMGSNTGAQSDIVYNILYGKNVLTMNFEEVYAKGDYYVYEKKDPEVLKIRSIDTMKDSRDKARWDLYEVDYETQLKVIKELGANYVSIDTPYDEEFYPVLKAWADAAHKEGLSVWYRGNWSGWEGWFEYPKGMTYEEHTVKTVEFIKNHQELFKDGDSFTPCPECEYGGPGNPLETGDVDTYRDFLISQRAEVDKAFKQTGRNVHTNWQSMNPDVAMVVVDQDFLSAYGGLITLDYYAKDVETFTKGLDYFSTRFPDAKILMGEFGAPIPDINGQMTLASQADYLKDSLSYFLRRGDVVGVNYWVCCSGTTAILYEDYDLKPAAIVLQEYYKQDDANR